MQSVYFNKENCCGCSACYSVCPRQAITMKPDEEGFLYPEIDQSRCVDCHRCTAICPLTCEGNYKQNGMPRFYAAYHKSKDVLLQSTSGGAFTAISDVVLRQEGVIYGADYDENFRVLHQRADVSEGRDRMRISKYVQSDMGSSFTRIKADLENGRTVLFTGTPCQTAGLRGFIGNSPLSEKLYLCDVICYSIPSPLVWEDYKRFLERKDGGKITSVRFRSKKNGWSRQSSSWLFFFTTDRTPEVQEDDLFYRLYLKAGAIIRPSCSQCRFTDVNRASDLTIADYWGIEKYSQGLYNSLGVSLILVNSPKGEALFQQCRQDMIIEERPMEEAFREQKRLNEPLPLPENRSRFWKDYQCFGFEYVLEQMLK
jgi:coenzyme F420-reducing hydrogenase beta subunit